MNPDPQPPVIVKKNATRDMAITIVFVVLLVAALGFGVVKLRDNPQGNSLRGEIVEKVFIPMKEEIVEFSGRRLKSTRESEGEYVLKVRVDSEGGRVFDVPVPKSLYVSKEKGDSLKFIRPKSEQK